MPSMLLQGSQLLVGGQCRAARTCRPFAPCNTKRLVSANAATASAPAAEAAAATSTSAAAEPLSYKAQLDFKWLKENVDAAAVNCKNRFSSADPRKVVELYDQYVKLKIDVDQIRAERNENSNAMKGKLEPEQRQALIARGQELKDKAADLEAQLAVAEAALQREGQRIPNMTHPQVPIGGEDNAAVLTLVGSQRQFDFTPKDHVTIAEALDMVDFESGAEVSGQKFYYLRNAGALLELALVNYAMTKVVSRGFTPIMTPDLVKASVLEKCGFQPRGSGTQIYSVADSPLCLTGTAEVPLGGIYMDRILPEDQLPVKMVAFGHCFRTEAGAAGMAGKGLYRVHQFSKVEMFVLSTPEQSEALHQELIDIETEMFTELGLHFKVLDMPSGDLGAPAYRKYDVEAWMPGLQRYGEISSASNCTDYQSRRLNIRYRPAARDDEATASSSAPDGGSPKKGGKGGKKGGGAKGGSSKIEFVHTLNATACAVPRMIVSILENFQQADGSVVVPVPLRPFLGGLDVIKPPASK